MITTCCACFARMAVRGSHGFMVCSFKWCGADTLIRENVDSGNCADVAGQDERWRTRVSALPVHCTTIFAVILGWMEQKYGYVPGLSNLKLNFSSVSSARDLKVVLSS